MLRFCAAPHAIKALGSLSWPTGSFSRVPLPVHSTRRVATLSGPAGQARPAMAVAESAPGSASRPAALQITSPLPGASWGAEVRGIDLNQDPPGATLQQLKSELTRCGRAPRSLAPGRSAASASGRRHRPQIVQCQVPVAPVLLIGPSIKFFDCLIGSPVTSHNTARRACERAASAGCGAGAAVLCEVPGLPVP